MRVLPDAGIDVIWRQGAGVFVAGPDTSAKMDALAPGTVLAGARLRPGAAGAALGIPMVELLDLRVDAEDLAGVPNIDGELEPAQALRGLLDAIGYGPKTLARVLRFQRFVRSADAAPERSLAELALDAGYADQAHLTREFTRLAGLPPAALRRSRGL